MISDFYTLGVDFCVISDFTDLKYFPSYFPEDFHQPQWVSLQLWVPTMILSGLAIAQYIAVAKNACEGNCYLWDTT